MTLSPFCGTETIPLYIISIGTEKCCTSDENFYSSKRQDITKRSRQIFLPGVFSLAHLQSDGIGRYGIAVGIGDDTVDFSAVTAAVHGGGISGGGSTGLIELGGRTVTGVVPGVGQAVALGHYGSLGGFAARHSNGSRLGDDFQRCAGGLLHGEGGCIRLHLVAVGIGDDAVDPSAVAGSIHSGGVACAGNGRLAELGSCAAGGKVPGVLQAVALCRHGGSNNRTLGRSHILRLLGDTQHRSVHKHGDRFRLHLVAVGVGNDAVDPAAVTNFIHNGSIGGCLGGGLGKLGLALIGIVPGVGQPIAGGLHLGSRAGPVSCRHSRRLSQQDQRLFFLLIQGDQIGNDAAAILIGDNTIDLTAVTGIVHDHRVGLSLAGGGQGEGLCVFIPVIPSVGQTLAADIQRCLSLLAVDHRQRTGLREDLEGDIPFQGDRFRRGGLAVHVGDHAVDTAAVTGLIHLGGIGITGKGGFAEFGTALIGKIPGVGQAFALGLNGDSGGLSRFHRHRLRLAGDDNGRTLLLAQSNRIGGDSAAVLLNNTKKHPLLA